MSYEFTPEEQFWRTSPEKGPTPKFATPEALREAAVQAFQHYEDHPHREEVLFHHKGQVVRTFKRVMRPYTFRGVALRMGTTTATLTNYRPVPGYSEVLDWMEEVIYTQKFEGAAGNMMNANFLARDLGLADKSELSGPNGGPLQTEEVSARDIINGKLARLVTRSPGDTSGAD